MEKRYRTDRYSTARAMKYIKRHAAQVKASGGIVEYMAGSADKSKRTQPEVRHIVETMKK